MQRAYGRAVGVGFHPQLERRRGAGMQQEEQKAEHDTMQRRKTKEEGSLAAWPGQKKGRRRCISGCRAYDLSSLAVAASWSCVRPRGDLCRAVLRAREEAVPWHAARRPKAKERSHRSNIGVFGALLSVPDFHIAPGWQLAWLPRRFRSGGRPPPPPFAANDKSSLLGQHDRRPLFYCYYSGGCNSAKSTARRHECQGASALCPGIEGEQGPGPGE